jgi:RNA polymerase sigma-54 factor
VSLHLPLLEKRDWGELARVLRVDLEEVKKAAEIIAHLEPKPGRTFYSEEPIAVTPDATVSFNEEGQEAYKIEIHDETVPELRINSYYRHLLRNKTTDEKTKVFIREKIQSAINFLRALKLRKSTLREITEEIVRVQSQFFDKGFSHLVPLRLKDIAHTLGIHESTVSRALQGKYIATPQGTIPYKSFFSTRLETLHGEAESQKSIMEKIKSLVEKEDSGNPLSDQAIVGVLNQEGILIARRTVAKYRDLLKILPSHLRRKK